jgi:hypothetical protein
MRHIFIASALISVVALSSCKKNEGAGKAGDTKAPAGKVAEPVAKVWKKIPSMGIEVEVAADADVQDKSATSGFPSSTIYSTDGTPTTFIFGAKDPSDSMAIPKDFDAAKTSVQKEHAKGFKAIKEEKTADGFVLTYSAMSIMDQPQFGVVIRSAAAGLTLDCQTNAPTEAELDKTITLCKSIRAAK